MVVSLKAHFDPAPLDMSLLGVLLFLDDLSPARNRIAADLEATIDGYFEDQAGPEGAWEELSPVTLAEKRRKGYDLRILHRTLALRNGIAVTASDSGDLGIIEAVSDLDYAATMHFGDTREAFGTGAVVEIPARPFLDINQRKEEEYQEVYLDQLDQAWRGAASFF